MSTYNDMPMVECPSCFKEFQWDDYYDIEAGSERACTHCGCTLIVESVDHRITATIEVKGFEVSASTNEEKS